MTFPAHLDRDVIIVDPAGMQDDWKLIGQEVTEELDYTPAKLYVRQTIRNKYSTPTEGIVIGEPLEQVLPKAMAGPALLAQILIDKYADHLPIYRQIERFKRMGVTLAASTISGWIGACCDLILPLHDTIRKRVLQSGYIQADENPIKVLDKVKKMTKELMQDVMKNKAKVDNINASLSKKNLQNAEITFADVLKEKMVNHIESNFEVFKEYSDNKEFRDFFAGTMFKLIMKDISKFNANK